MRCIYCDREIEKYTLTSLLIKEDPLCISCRNKLKFDKKIVYLDDLKVETLYEYEGIFKSLLLQYKECLDEALGDVFLYGISDYINLKYMGYKLLFVPSSAQKLDFRGFNHLQMLFSDVKLRPINGLKMKENIIQEGKNYNDRLKMVNNYYYEGERVNKVLIVDDVLTSGSTMKGVYNAIKPYAKKVKGLCLANKRKRFHS